LGFFCPHVSSTNFANFLGKFCQIFNNTKWGKEEKKRKKRNWLYGYLILSITAASGYLENLKEPMVSLKKERACGFVGSYLNFMQFLWEP
jgi:hypothetical protein